MDAQTRAERVASLIMDKDPATNAMGMQLVSITPGQAVLTMKVRDDQLNGHRMAHGGAIFTLADSAFAFACNSYNQIVVAQTNTINYITPGQPGETLRAEAREVSRTGRSGVYDVTVLGEDGRTVALFRGQSRQISGQHFPEPEEPRADA